MNKSKNYVINRVYSEQNTILHSKSHYFRDGPYFKVCTEETPNIKTRTAETHSNGGVECISIVSIAYTTSIPTLYLFLDHVKYLPTRTFSLMAQSPTYSLL